MNDCDHCLSAHAQIIEIVSLSVQFLSTNLVHDVRAGPGLSYAVAVLPHGFAILAVESACYVVVLAVTTNGGDATG